MKRNLILALTIFALAAGRIAAQSNSDIFLIGNSWIEPAGMSDETYNNTPYAFESIIDSRSRRFLIWSREQNYTIRLVHSLNTEMKIADLSLSQLECFDTIDVDWFLASMTNEQVREWVEENSAKKIWVIDRNDFYKSSPEIPQYDRMKLIQVVLLPENQSYDGTPRAYTSE